MKVYALLALFLLFSQIQSGLFSFLTGDKPKEDENAANAVEPEEEDEMDKKHLMRPLEAPDFESNFNDNPFEKAYADTKAHPDMGDSDRDLTGEPIDLVSDSDDGSNQNSGMFDIQKFFHQLRNIDCSKEPPVAEDSLQTVNIKPDSYSDLCEEAIKSKLLYPMSKANHHALDLFNYLKKFVYLPLGMDMRAKYTFPEVLIDTFFLSDDSSMISKDLKLPTNEEFYKEVSSTFKNIEGYSSDFDTNQEKISAEIIDLLKKFHIFWNVHRNRHQMNSVEKNTLQIIHGLLRTFRKTTAVMKNATLHVLNSIKDGYFRFLRAYRMWQILQKKPLEMIALQIIRRYKENLERIRLHKSSNEVMSIEIAYMLDMLRAFFLLNNQYKIEDGENLKRYEVGIFQKITYIYETYRKYLIENGEACYEDVRTFTATLLLKMQHRAYIIFKVYTINSYKNLPAFVVENQSTSAIKIYYEIFDQFLVVPIQCLDLTLTNLELCVGQKGFAAIQNEYTNYQLFASVSGNDLVQFLRSGYKEIMKKLDKQKGYNDYDKFKSIYYPELTKFALLYRQKYGIHDMSVLDELENNLGYEIEKTKSINKVSKTDYDVIDLFDRTLYDFFLTMKTKYNQFAPLNKDTKLLKSIENDLEGVMNSFRRENIRSFNNDMDNLFTDIQNVCKLWLQDHSVHFIINSHSLNNDPSIIGHTNLSLRNSALVQQAMNNPVVASNFIPNLFATQKGLAELGYKQEPLDLNKY